MAEVIRRRWPIILSCVLFIPAAVFLVLALQPRQHRSRIIVQPNALAPADLIVSEEAPAAWFGTPTADFIALLARTSSVRLHAANLADQSPTSLGRIDARVNKKTGWVSLYVRGDTVQAAERAANALAAAIGRDLQARTRGGIGVLQRSLQRRFGETRDPAKRREIAAQLAAFRAFRPSRQQTIQVIEPATDAGLASNGAGVAAVLSLIAAALLAWWLVKVLERADPRLHDVDDVEAVASAPLLTTVTAANHAAPEPYLRLRDGIRFLRDQRTDVTVLVTSPTVGDGRTSVAIGLATAYAASGCSVALVDADMRNPHVGAVLGLRPGQGLAEVLRGVPLDSVLRYSGEPDSGFHVLTAGQRLVGSADLLASVAMSTLMAALRDRFDVVVVDTPPLLAVSDALALVPYSSGVVVVARLDHSTRRGLRRALLILEKAGATVFGPVAMGARADTGFAQEPVEPDRALAVQGSRG